MSDSMCYTRERLEILDKAQLIEIILENFSVPLEAKSSKSQVSSCDKPSTKALVNSTSNCSITPITSNKKLKYPKQNNKSKHSTKHNANWSLPEPDWNTVNFRKVALKFAYLGKEFDGLQIQTESNNTIESHLWEAIVGCKLRPGDCMPGPNYTRCARTDKGVSAFEQVITMELKSNLERRFSDNSRPVESENRTQERNSVSSFRFQAESDKLIETHFCINPRKEYDFVSIINSRLPPEIRIQFIR